VSEILIFNIINIINYLIFKKGYTIFNEKFSKYKHQNYTVAFNHNNQQEIGLIKKFFSIDNSVYCLLQLFRKKRNFIEEIPENESIIQTLDRFFLICNLTNNLLLIKIENIIGKCVSLENGEEYFVSICIEEFMD